MITVLQRVGPPNDNLTTKKGKNVFQRGSQYVDDVEKKRGNKPLWKHVQVKHGSVMSVPMFSHFKMEAKAWPALVFGQNFKIPKSLGLQSIMKWPDMTSPLMYYMF